MYVDARSECNGSQIIVTSGSGPVGGAKVIVFQTPSLIDVFSGTTDADGRIAFNACGLSVRAYASKDGYENAEGEFELVSCGSCQAPPECTDDSGCAADMACSGQKCVAVQCACGTVSNHQCVKYACCSDSDCGAGKKCSNHACVSSEQPKPPEQPKPECTSDSDCGSGKVCTGNKCVLKPECQKDSDCQSGYGCTTNKCVRITQNTTTNKTSTSGGTPAAPSSTGNTGTASASGPEPVLMVGLLILLVAVLLVVVYFIRPRKK
jgi:Cys-rich repeat protein